MRDKQEKLNCRIGARKDVLRMIRVGIIGATGYAGGELVRILMGHKEAEIEIGRASCRERV